MRVILLALSDCLLLLLLLLLLLETGDAVGGGSLRLCMPLR